MPKKEIIQVNLAAPNPNLSPATRFGNLVFVAGQTGRHPITGEVGRTSVSKPAMSWSASK
jgi:enamine deaminase RidA (YjgF/YER057c/UK114 family)